MKNKIKSGSYFIKVVAAFVLLTAWLSAANASVVTYSLSQSGWRGGGEVTGLFSGEDLNSDGFLSLSDGEVNSYMVTFSGNDLVSSFSHDLTDLLFFRYTIGSSGFRPSFPLYSNDGNYFYDADDYSIARTDFSVWITTTEDAVVRAVPEPSIGALLVAGCIGFIARRKRR